MSEETATQLLSADESSPDLTRDQLEGASSKEAETSIAAAQTSDSNQSQGSNGRNVVHSAIPTDLSRLEYDRQANMPDPKESMSMCDANSEDSGDDCESSDCDDSSSGSSEWCDEPTHHHHPSHHEAWKAGLESHDCAVVHGAMLQAPSITTDIPSRLKEQVVASIATEATETTIELHPLTNVDGTHAPPPKGFTLSGTVDLFDMESLSADFYSYHGPLPAWLDPEHGIPPIYQIAMLAGDLRLSSLLPAFSGTNFDSYSLKNVTFTYQNIPLDETKMVGFTLESDILFDSSYGEVHDVLKNFFGFNEPSLHVSCGLGEQDWHQSLRVSSFQLMGLFTDAKPNPPSENLQLTGVGARLTGYSRTYCNEDGEIVYGRAYGYALFGTMHMTVPWSVIPLEMGFDIEARSGDVRLEAFVHGRWESAFGVKQLTLDEVGFTMRLDPKVPMNTLQFDVSALLEFNSSFISLYGHFSTSGDYLLQATFEQLDFNGLNDVFHHFFQDTLSIPDVNIHVGAATITIAKGVGFTLEVHDLKIGDHTASDGVVKVGTAGVSLRANIKGDALKIENVEINNPFVDIQFGRKEHGTKTSVMFGGKVLWEGREFDVGVHVYQSRDPKQQGLEFTVYGQFVALDPKKGLPLKDLVPTLENTSMSELHLQGAALVIASADDAELGALTHSKYQIRKGVQVCAVLSDLPTVNKIVGENKGQSLGLILRAGWSPSAGFSLDIFFPSPTTFHIGQGIITDPISLKIVLGGTPQLKIIGGAFIPVEGRKEPLHFHLDLTLETLTASATGQLSAPGGWRNPFGISEQLVIGPDLALKFSIVYSTFFIQGPSGFGFVGGLKIGKVVGKMEFNIEEVPSRQLLSAKVENLDLHDLVEFANNVSPVPIARPPNVVSFHEVSLYMCPAGVTIGTIIYPAGFSFISKVTLFGINADVNVSVGSSGVKCKGGIDNFKLGPLTVRGVKEPRAMFELELTSSKQAGKIDGMIEFLGVEIVMVANFELHPNFTFHFMFLLHLTDLFTFEVYAYPISTPSEENPDVTVTDYRLTAEFRNKTRDQLTLKINKMFDEKARREAKEAETTQQKLDEARQAWQADMDEKQRKLDKAYASWTTKSSETHDRLESIKREQKAKVDDLRHKLEHEREKLHRNVNETQAALTAANNERSARLHKDRENLQAKRAEWDGYISNAHRKVDDTTRDLHNRFGNTERDIEEARRKVNSLEQDIDNFDREIDRLGLTPWWDLPSKAQIPALATAKGALIFSKEVADGVLRMALGVVEAQDFIVRKGAMQLAHFALDEAQRCGATAIRIADEALALTDRLTTELVANANKALEGARWLGNTAVDAADGALVVAEKSSIVIIAAAQALVDGLTSCAEWIAYQAASAAVAVAKEAGSDALLLAKVGAKIGTAISQFAMKAWQWILLHLTSFVDIREIVLSAQLGMACGGAEFDAAIRGTMADDHFFDFHISFSTAHTTEFITAIFDKLVDMIEDGFLEGGKAITAVAQGLSGDLVKSLQQL